MAAISSAFITETVGGVQRYLDALMKESLSKYHDAIVAGGGGEYTKWFGRIESFKDVIGFKTDLFTVKEVPKVFMGEKRWLINVEVTKSDRTYWHTDGIGSGNRTDSTYTLKALDNYGRLWTLATTPFEGARRWDAGVTDIMSSIEIYIATDTSEYPLSDRLIKKYKGINMIGLVVSMTASARDLAKYEYDSHILRTKMRELEEASRSKDARILELEAELKALRTPPTVDLLGIFDSSDTAAPPSVKSSLPSNPADRITIITDG